MGNLGAAGDPREVYKRYQEQDQGPVPFTIGGKTPEQLDNEVQQRQQAAATSQADPVVLAHKLIDGVGAAFDQHRQQVDEQVFDKRTGRTHDWNHRTTRRLSRISPASQK